MNDSIQDSEQHQKGDLPARSWSPNTTAIVASTTSHHARPLCLSKCSLAGCLNGRTPPAWAKTIDCQTRVIEQSHRACRRCRLLLSVCTASHGPVRPACLPACLRSLLARFCLPVCLIDRPTVCLASPAKRRQRSLTEQLTPCQSLSGTAALLRVETIAEEMSRTRAAR